MLRARASADRARASFPAWRAASACFGERSRALSLRSICGRTSTGVTASARVYSRTRVRGGREPGGLAGNASPRHSLRPISRARQRDRLPPGPGRRRSVSRPLQPAARTTRFGPCPYRARKALRAGSGRHGHGTRAPNHRQRQPRSRERTTRASRKHKTPATSDPSPTRRHQPTSTRSEPLTAATATRAATCGRVFTGPGRGDSLQGGALGGRAGWGLRVGRIRPVLRSGRSRKRTRPCPVMAVGDKGGKCGWGRRLVAVDGVLPSHRA